jgi:hypothetical protein
MPNENPCDETTFGYLSMVKSAEHGYFGGYLVIDYAGRPLEFHCTAPIRPSRAQQILYGPTLEPFLLGEQIAGALLQAAQLKPSLVVVDCDAALQAQLRIGVPVVLLCENSDKTPDASTGGARLPSNAHAGNSFAIGNYDFQAACGFEPQCDDVVQLLTSLARHVDLAEPFGRIEDAIREAQRLGGGAETHDQAA